jgi:hypothetical protein
MLGVGDSVGNVVDWSSVTVEVAMLKERLGEYEGKVSPITEGFMSS